MSAVLGCTFGEAASDRSSRKIVQALIKECIDVCRKGGVTIEPIQGKDVVRLLDYNGPVKKALSFMIIPIAIRKHARLKASMLQDLERGKKTEVDAINGSVSAYGRKVGCPTPTRSSKSFTASSPAPWLRPSTTSGSLPKCDVASLLPLRR